MHVTFLFTLALNKKKVLIAPLDWGMGHATRCVPVIRQFQKNGYEVILASNGTSNEFLKNYFPELLLLEKPGYNISYPENMSMVNAMIRQLPSLMKTIIKEHLWLKKIIRKYKISEVVSDNCYGLWNKNIHSVFITHQLKVKCPDRIRFLEPILQRIILFFINKYDECHIPDLPGTFNYSGNLSHLWKQPSNSKFIGTLSRFSENINKINAEIYDLVILLSGPEPQRTIFENKCLNLIERQKSKCCIIRGLPGNTDTKENSDSITWYNHLSDDKLKAVLLNSKKIACRSGYSTIMDLVELNLPATLVPTPGQTEQEYLAFYNSEKGNFEFVNQENLSLKDLLNDTIHNQKHYMV